MILFAYLCPNGCRYTPGFTGRPASYPQTCHGCGAERVLRPFSGIDLAAAGAVETGPRDTADLSVHAAPHAPAKSADSGGKPSSAADAHCGVCWARPAPDGSLDHDPNCPALLYAAPREESTSAPDGDSISVGDPPRRSEGGPEGRDRRAAALTSGAGWPD